MVTRKRRGVGCAGLPARCTTLYFPSMNSMTYLELANQGWLLFGCQSYLHSGSRARLNDRMKGKPWRASFTPDSRCDMFNGRYSCGYLRKPTRRGNIAVTWQLSRSQCHLYPRRAIHVNERRPLGQPPPRCGVAEPSCSVNRPLPCMTARMMEE